MHDAKTELTRVSTSTRGVAAILGISNRKAASLVLSGELASFRIGRRRLVRIADVEEFAARRAREEQERRSVATAR